MFLFSVSLRYILIFFFLLIHQLIDVKIESYSVLFFLEVLFSVDVMIYFFVFLSTISFSDNVKKKVKMVLFIFAPQSICSPVCKYLLLTNSSMYKSLSSTTYLIYCRGRIIQQADRFYELHKITLKRDRFGPRTFVFLQTETNMDS